MMDKLHIIIIIIIKRKKVYLHDSQKLKRRIHKRAHSYIKHVISSKSKWSRHNSEPETKHAVYETATKGHLSRRSPENP